MGKEFRITPALQESIASGIRAGGYPYVAAEAAGIPKAVFDDWLARGNEKDPWEPYRTFTIAIRQACAQARLRAEIAEYKDQPRHWLLHGPGRESEQRPGWSVSVSASQVSSESRNMLLDPEVMNLMRLVLEALEPFPEARTRVVDVLLKLDLMKHLPKKGPSDEAPKLHADVGSP